YEWLCGKRPFEGRALQIIQQHLYTPPPPLRDWSPTLPAAVETVILRALAKDPRERFVSVQAFAQALARASQQHLPDDEHKSQITAPLKAVAAASFLSGALMSPQYHTQMKRSQTSTKSSNRRRLLAKVHAF